MKPTAVLTKADVQLALTFDDGVTRNHRFELDDRDEGRPITLAMETEVDVVDATDYALDMFVRREAGDRQTFTLSIGGRGPRDAAATVVDAYGYARPFRITHENGDVLHGVQFPSGRCVVDGPFGFDVSTTFRQGAWTNDAKVEWADGGAA